jgi:hypothetical protein
MQRPKIGENQGITSGGPLRRPNRASFFVPSPRYEDDPGAPDVTLHLVFHDALLRADRFFRTKLSSLSPISPGQRGAIQNSPLLSRSASFDTICPECGSRIVPRLTTLVSLCGARKIRPQLSHDGEGTSGWMNPNIIRPSHLPSLIASNGFPSCPSRRSVARTFES